MSGLDYLEYLAKNPVVNTQLRLLDGLFAEQRGLCTDRSRLRGFVCPRRSGKTWGVTRLIADTCLTTPNARVGYLTKTRDWAEELVWEPLKALSKRYELGAAFHAGKLRGVYPNGAILRLAGAKDKAQVESLRGFAYNLLVIDEAGSIDPEVMRYVVKEVLPAALGERQGILLVGGTPNRSCSGWFHDITTSPDSGLSVHQWGLRHNIYHQRWAHAATPEERERLIEEFLDEECRTHGLKRTDPEFLREYEGKWARDETLFIFSIGPECVDLPPDPKKSKIRLTYILSIDLGWEDRMAWELLGYNQSEQKLWEIDNYNAQHLTMDQVREKTVDYLDNYRLEKIVVDAAGAGKIIQETIAREYARRYGVPCEAANKQQKAAYMKYAASDCRTGKCFFLPDSVARDQLNEMEWDDRYMREKEPSEGKFNDNADSWIYGYKECYHWLHEPREETPEVGTPEHANWEMAKIEEAEADALEETQRGDWWENI